MQTLSLNSAVVLHFAEFISTSPPSVLVLLIKGKVFLFWIREYLPLSSVKIFSLKSSILPPQKFPGYREEKKRCEYLHEKLSYIKQLIIDYDVSQASS